MQRTFITNLAFLLLLNLLVKPVWLLFFDVQVQEQVGEDAYGMYFAALNLTFLFNILTDFGITNFNNRNIAMHSQLFAKHFPAVLTLRAILGIVYMGFVLLLGVVLGYNYFQMEILGWLALNQVLISAVLYFRSNLNGLFLFRQDSIISVLDRALMIAFCALLLYGPFAADFNIYWFVWLQTAAYGLTAIIAFLLVLRKAKRLRFHFNWPFSMLILKQSLPFALLFVLMSLYNRTDSVMIERMLDDGAFQTGIYAKAFRLLDAFNMFAMLFATMLLPLFSRMIKAKEPTGPLTALAFKLLGSTAVLAAVTCIVFGNELMHLLYDDNVAQVTPVFQTLMLSFVSLSTTYIFGTLLTAGNHMRLLNAMAFAGVLLNIGLNIWLIPAYGAWGAALASVVTQFLTAIAQVIMAKQVFGYAMNYKLIGGWLLLAMGVTGLAWSSMYLPMGWEIRLALVVLFGIILAILIRMIDLKALWQMVREMK